MSEIDVAERRETIGALGFAIWVLDEKIALSDLEWARAAWDDMGGSEPDDERALVEIRAEKILPSLMDAFEHPAEASLEDLIAFLCARRQREQEQFDLYREGARALYEYECARALKTDPASVPADGFPRWDDLTDEDQRPYLILARRVVLATREAR